METMKTIASRNSVRSYKPEQISETELDRILRAGCAAPVGMGMYQDILLTVVQDKEILQRISALVKNIMNTEGDPLYGAPSLIIISSKDMPAPGIDYANAGCIMENMMLEAVESGLGSVVVWGTAFAVSADTELKKTLGIPEEYHALSSVAIGKSNVSLPPKDMELKIKIERV